ncbi:VOC family protein [Nocardioides sp. R-C-SC26]|uniref:VOC family protein n=1 Tax=Nocardioides sp. R-C-SC26 TaxID=2870414 RepID=UPI001E59F1F4|nr:VOC family protein [Nocardioides sp. R-C-SC26]
MSAARIGHVIVPAEGGLDAAIAFYVDELGLELRFRDGDRYAAVTDGTTTLGLAAESEQPVPGEVCVSVQVPDLDVALEAWRSVDGYEIGAVVDGPHERRVVVRPPDGAAVCVYEKSPA